MHGISSRSETDFNDESAWRHGFLEKQIPCHRRAFNDDAHITRAVHVESPSSVVVIVVVVD